MPCRYTDWRPVEVWDPDLLCRIVISWDRDTVTTKREHDRVPTVGGKRSKESKTLRRMLREELKHRRNASPTISEAEAIAEGLDDYELELEDAYYPDDDVSHAGPWYSEALFIEATKGRGTYSSTYGWCWDRNRASMRLGLRRQAA